MRTRTVIFTILALVWVFAGGCRTGAGPKAMAVSSPDGALTVSLSLESLPQPHLPGQRAYYRVAYKDVPVVAMTAGVMATDVVKLKSAGFNGLIGKPIRKKLFPGQLDKILAGESIWEVH